MIEDKTLINGILSRDRRALSTFYRAYAPKLSCYIASKIHNPKDAEEVLQDTLFHFLESLRDFEGKSKIQTFLYAICNHKIIDYYRRKKLRHVVFSQIPQLEAQVAEFKTPEEELDTTLLTEKISNTLARILPTYKTLLLSKYADDLSVVEIANKLSLTVKSVESMLFRARRAFVKAFVSL